MALRYRGLVFMPQPVGRPGIYWLRWYQGEKTTS